MRKLLTCTLFYLFSISVSSAQTDKRLVERLDSVLFFTQVSDLDAILDFTYPKLFTIVPRPQMRQALEEALENDEFSTTFDSVKVSQVYPVFTIGKGNYALIRHTILMKMKFRETIDTADEEVSEVLESMAEEFGKDYVRFDKKENTIRILLFSDLVAIRDEYAPEWSFVNFDRKKESPIATRLFSGEVLQKLKTFN